MVVNYLSIVNDFYSGVICLCKQMVLSYLRCNEEN